MDFLTGSLGVRPSFEGISILGNIISRYKVKEIVNTFLLPRDACMPEMHLR